MGNTMASRKIEDLHPDLIPLCQHFLLDCKDAGLDILVTCTYRSNIEQDALYAQGRTKPGKIVTNAKRGQSEHNFTLKGRPASKAFDIVPLVHGKCDWDLTSTAWKQIKEIWEKMKPINGYYLDWYGRKDAPFREGCHFCLKEVKK
jgi:peptidoglycan LD-endopeptidase CwlK